jgi:hypothetical protein
MIMTNICNDEIPKDSFIIAMKGLRTLSGLEEPSIQDFITEAKLDTKTAEQIKESITQMRAWIMEDKDRLAQFQASPLITLQEKFPNLLNTLPEILLSGLDDDLSTSACSELPPSSIYADCVIEILRRVAMWIRRSPANHDRYVENSDAAVDTVAGSAPTIAIALAKDAIHKSRAMLTQRSST